MMACREQNGLPETDARDLTDKQFTIIRKAAGRDGEINYRRFCMHCQEPTCASVCPVGALHKTAAGPVVYNAEICLGCRYCIQACPFSIPKYEWTARVPRVRKCNFCADRLAQGRINACAEACPYGATIAGDRDALLKEARARWPPSPASTCRRSTASTMPGEPRFSCFLRSVRGHGAAGKPARRADADAHLPRALEDSTAVSVGASVLAGLWWFTRRKEAVARAEGRAYGRVDVPAAVPDDARDDTPEDIRQGAPQ